MENPSNKWELTKKGEAIDLKLFQARFDWYLNKRTGKEEKMVFVDADDAVCVVALDKSGKVILVRQFRFGVEKDTLEAPGGLVSLPWAVDGSDPNIPLASQLNFRSQNALVLLGAIDRAVVNWTRLESRFRTSFIYVKDSMRMYGSYVQVLEYLKAFAGDANRVDMAAGVRPTEEPLGPTDSPNLKTETVAGSVTNR